MDKLKAYYSKLGDSANSMTEKIKNEFILEFFNFLQKYGVIGLAIGVVMGTAVNDLVNNLVKNIISPLITVVLNFALRGVQLESWAIYGFGLGSFTNAMIKFTLISFIVFVTVRFFISNFLSEEEQLKLNVKKKNLETDPNSKEKIQQAELAGVVKNK